MKSEELASGGDCNRIAEVNEQLQREMTGCYLRVFILSREKNTPSIASILAGLVGDEFSPAKR